MGGARGQQDTMRSRAAATDPAARTAHPAAQADLSPRGVKLRALTQLAKEGPSAVTERRRLISAFGAIGASPIVQRVTVGDDFTSIYDEVNAWASAEREGEELSDDEVDALSDAITAAPEAARAAFIRDYINMLRGASQLRTPAHMTPYWGNVSVGDMKWKAPGVDQGVFYKGLIVMDGETEYPCHMSVREQEDLADNYEIHYQLAIVGSGGLKNYYMSLRPGGIITKATHEAGKKEKKNKARKNAGVWADVPPSVQTTLEGLTRLLFFRYA